MEQIKFKFEDYKITSSVITIGKSELGESFDFDFDMDGEYNKPTFTLIMHVSIEDTNKMAKVNVSLNATFKVDTDNEREFNGFLYVNAPAIVFPYLRAYVSALTSLSGVNTIVLPTLNLTEKGQELKAKMKAKQAQVAAE